MKKATFEKCLLLAKQIKMGNQNMFYPIEHSPSNFDFLIEITESCPDICRSSNFEKKIQFSSSITTYSEDAILYMLLFFYFYHENFQTKEKFGIGYYCEVDSMVIKILLENGWKRQRIWQVFNEAVAETKSLKLLNSRSDALHDYIAKYKSKMIKDAQEDTETGTGG